MPYLDDILVQPDALQNTLDGLARSAVLSPFANNLLDAKYHRVVLTGMGSSYHGAHPAVYRLIRCGINAQAIETSELIHHAPALLEPGTLVVAISQSGISAEIVHLLEMLDSGVDLIGVTNNADSDLARKARAVVLTQAGQEASVSCKTYLAILAALVWLVDELTRQPTEFKLLADSPKAVAKYLSHWKGHVENLETLLAGVRQLYLVGRGSSLAAVGTGGLIIKEAAHFPTEGMSSAAFRHGPFEMVSPEVFVTVFEGAKGTARLNRQLARDVMAVGGKAGFVHSSDQTGVFKLPLAPEPVLPILEMLPGQMLSLALAEMQGVEAGKFQQASKVTTVE